MKQIIINPYVYPGINFKHTRRWMEKKKKIKKLIVAKYVTEVYRIPFRNLGSKKRHYYATARAMCSYILCEKMGYKAEEIGFFLGLDRTSICVAVKKIRKQLKSDIDIRRNFSRIDEKLQNFILNEDTNTIF